MPIHTIDMCMQHACFISKTCAWAYAGKTPRNHARRHNARRAPAKRAPSRNEAGTWSAAAAAAAPAPRRAAAAAAAAAAPLPAAQERPSSTASHNPGDQGGEWGNYS